MSNQSERLEQAAILGDIVGKIGPLEYGDEIPGVAIAAANKAGAVIIHGYSDDGVIIEGAATDDASVYGGGTFWVDKEGCLPIGEDGRLADDLRSIEECVKLAERFKRALKVEAIWGEDDADWQYEIESQPYAFFQVLEDGRLYCRGVVAMLPKQD